MKVLNLYAGLYAGIGGNRKLWPKECKVTAIENNKEIAKIYKDFFPNDKVKVADAHQYLLDHYKEFDFIWSSPPCPTHSGTNHFLNAQGVIRYPDMNLYQEIILLKTWFKGKWVVENVISYYEPLIKPYQSERHYFWSNFYITPFKTERTWNIANARSSTRKSEKYHDASLAKYHGFDLSNYKIANKRKLLRNCVYPKLGSHIFNCAFKIKQQTLNT